MVQEAYIQGVSTRKVDDLVQALGMTGVSKSQVSRLCGEMDQAVTAFLERPLEGQYPYVWLDAKYIKVRESGRVVNMALVIAVGVRETGDREVLGLDVGLSQDGAFWTAFLRGLVARGLKVVMLVTSASDAHVRTAFAQPDQKAARVQLGKVVESLQQRFPRSAQMLQAAEDDILAYMSFPGEHRIQKRA